MKINFLYILFISIAFFLILDSSYIILNFSSFFVATRKCPGKLNTYNEGGKPKPPFLFDLTFKFLIYLYSAFFLILLVNIFLVFSTLVKLITKIIKWFNEKTFHKIMNFIIFTNVLLNLPISIFDLIYFTLRTFERIDRKRS
jgi:hypothetical protein